VSLAHRNRTVSSLTLGAVLCLFITSPALPISVHIQDETAEASAAHDLHQRITIERTTPPRWTDPIARPPILKNWAAPPSNLDTALRTEESISVEFESHMPPLVDPVEVSANNAATARVALAEGVSYIEAGRLDPGIAALRRSARIDPNPAAVWSALGLALLDQQNSIAAKSALREAIARGEESLEPLFAYGRLASQFREDRIAGATLYAALGHPDLRSDPAYEPLIRAELGSTLLRLGHIDAASRNLITLTNLPEQFEAETAYRRPLDQLYRTRRALMIEAAEASYSIGAFDRALKFSEAAGALPGQPDPRDLAARCFVLLHAGWPASAAGVVLDRFQSSVPDQFAIDLLSMVAAQSDVGTLIAQRIQKIESELPDADRVRSRQGFTIARSSMLDSVRDQIEVLRAHLDRHPTDIGVLARFIDRASAEQVLALIHKHPALEPEIAEIFLSVHAEATIEDTPPGPLRLRLLCRQNQYPHATQQATEIAKTERVVFPELLVVTSLLVDAARGADADALIDRSADQITVAHEALTVARAMLQRGRFRDSLSLTDKIIRDEKSPLPIYLFALHIAAQSHARLGDTDEAQRLSRVALDADPHEFLASRFLSQLTDAPADTNHLRSIPGAEPEVLLIQSRAALAREQFDLAERQLLEAWEFPLASDEAAALLANLWLRTNSLPKAERWLDEQAQRFPDRERLAVLLSRVRSEDRRPEDSLHGIATLVASRPGNPSISRELERIQRDDLAQENAWLSQARARLQNSAKTFATFAESAEIELIAGDLAQAIALAEVATDLAPALRATESRLISRFLEDAAEDIVNRPRVDAEVVGTFKRVFDRLDRPSRGAYLGRISIASISEVPDADELAALAIRAGDSHPDIREEAFIYAAQSVMIASRTSQTTLEYDESRELASELYARATRKLNPYPTKVLGEWIEFSQQTQDFFVLGEAIRSLGDLKGQADRRLRDALVYVLTAGNIRQQQSLEPEMLAELAHRLASQLSLSEQFSTAQVLYEEGLRNKPDHIELNNSYGYLLLERDEQVERAIEMIELAYSRSPNSAHIADSMGRARYKQGRLTDDTDPETGRVVLGAVTLLQQALALAEQQDETGMTGAFTADHYGDALWATGQRERAVTAWNDAANRAESAMKGFGGVQLPLSLELELENLIERARGKARAASEDRWPDIEPYEGMPAADEAEPD